MKHCIAGTRELLVTHAMLGELQNIEITIERNQKTIDELREDNKALYTKRAELLDKLEEKGIHYVS